MCWARGISSFCEIGCSCHLSCEFAGDVNENTTYVVKIRNRSRVLRVQIFADFPDAPFVLAVSFFRVMRDVSLRIFFRVVLFERRAKRGASEVRERVARRCCWAPTSHARCGEFPSSPRGRGPDSRKSGSGRRQPRPPAVST